MDKAADYRHVIVAWRNGSPVRLDEIAKVYDSVENDKIATWFNGTRAIVLAIYKQPDANTVAVVDGVLAKLPMLRAQIPPSVKIDVTMDRSVSIRQSVSDVEETAADRRSALVILVIFLFLRSASATFIPALAVPISLLGTFAAMYMLDFSINNMTLLALTLSVGFVVDDAIVMLENIVRHIEHGMRPYEAALKGAREIGFTIISITFSLIAVFIPVLLMGGIVGRVFREFAVTIAVAIVVSGFVSLTLTPMLCARVLKAHDETRKPNIVLRCSSGCSSPGLRAYEWALDWVLARKAIDAGGDAGDARRHDRALHRRAQGILPAGRHRLSVGRDGSRDRHLVRGDDGSPEGAVRHSEPGSGGRIHQLDGRRGRPQSDGELRPVVHRAETAERAEVGDRGDGASAPEGDRRCRECRRSSRASRTSTSAGGRRRASTSTPCRAATPKRCTGWRRRCATGSPRCRDCSTSPPISTSRTRR